MPSPLQSQGRRHFDAPLSLSVGGTVVPDAKPTVLYKYFSLRSARTLHSVLAQSQLFFSDPTTFNDPFEMNPGLYRHKKFRPVVSRKSRIDDATIRRAAENIWHQQRVEMQRSGVCCFSEVRDDLALWAHYADKHTGICLGFSTGHEFFDGIQKVDYVPKRPQMPLLEKRGSTRLVDLMRTKLDLWSYEKEWRLFRRSRNRLYKFPTRAITEIIFGFRCKAADRDLVRRVAGGLDVSYFEAVLSPYEYELQISKVDSE